MIIYYKKNGFTLIEVLASIGIFLVIIVAVGLFEVNVFSYQRTASSSFQTVQDAQIILKTITKDIRMASPGSDGAYALQTVGTGTLMFFSDINANGIKERVRYTLIGSNLYRAVAEPIGSPLSYVNATESTSTILSDVVNGSVPVFNYYDGTYAGSTTGALSQPVNQSSVRLIQITLMLDPDTHDTVPARTYSTEVTLRNLKDNL
jgi:prepilin-type N-terminal cleavage/methylation domain-containing protein